jgi:2,3-bisphosphoglycerate-dependent phosphoglycerate mutase
MSTRICVIRHGETDWNVEKRIQGHLDIPLNATGRTQALAMAFDASHHHFQAIYSSDLARAAETAHALAERLGLEVKPTPQFRERNYGIFQGLTASEAAQLYPEAHERYQNRDPDYDFETGETMHRLVERIAEGVDWLARHHTEQTLALVSHSGVLDILYRISTGRPLHTPRDFVVPNCGLNWFHFDGQGWHLEKWGDRHYLLEVLAEPPE